MAIFSFLGVEIVAVTSGEAKDPTTALPRALRWTLGRMGLFYVGGLAVVVGIVPWNEVGLGESPFVRVFETVGIPAAAGIMNFVVQARNARPGASDIKRGNVRRALCGSLVSREGVRLHAGVGVSGRHFCMADDFRDASGVSPPIREMGYPANPICPARPMELRLRTRSADRSSHLDLVGSRITHHTGRGSSLACVHFGVLPCLEKGPFPEVFRWSSAKWMNC
jgi:hypothetical protein